MKYRFSLASAAPGLRKLMAVISIPYLCARGIAMSRDHGREGRRRLRGAAGAKPVERASANPRRGGSFGRVAQVLFPVGAIEIVARQRNGILFLGQLELEHYLPVVAEGHLAGEQVIAPHPAEAFVVKRARLVDI